MTYEELRKRCLAFGGFSPLETADVATIVRAIVKKRYPFPDGLALTLGDYIQEQRSEQQGDDPCGVKRMQTAAEVWHNYCDRTTKQNEVTVDQKETPPFQPSIPSRVFICNSKGDGSVDVQSDNLIYCNGPGSYAKAMKMFPGPAVVIPVPQGLEATQDGTADNSKGDR